MLDTIQHYLIDNWVSLIGAIIGLIYLYLEYKANIMMWFVSIVMAVFYIFIFFSSQLYASMGIYIYFLGASVYGWLMWLKKHGETEIAKPLNAPRSVLSKVLTLIAISFGAIFTILYFFAPQDVIIPIKIGDALTTALNVVALWMVSRRWAEQWLLVIPANLLTSILFFVQNDILSSVLFFIYFIVSIGGYYNWKKMAR